MSVKLNVGGQPFETFKSTLKSPYFDRLFSSDFEQPEDGIYFVDADPEAFKIILNWFRTEVIFLNGYSEKLLYATADSLEVTLPKIIREFIIEKFQWISTLESRVSELKTNGYEVEINHQVTDNKSTWIAIYHTETFVYPNEEVE